MYTTLADSDEDFVAHTSVAAANVGDISGIFGTVCQSIHQCNQVCITGGGFKFEQLLKTVQMPKRSHRITVLRPNIPVQ